MCIGSAVFFSRLLALNIFLTLSHLLGFPKHCNFMVSGHLRLDCFAHTSNNTHRWVKSIHDVPVMVCLWVTPPPSGYGLSMHHDHYSLSAVPRTTDTKAMGNRQAAIWKDLYPNIQHCPVWHHLLYWYIQLLSLDMFQFCQKSSTFLALMIKSSRNF